MTLITLLTLGLGTAAVEKWRQDEFDRVWGRFHDKLSILLNPISERTHRVVAVAFKLDHLFKVEDENRKMLREVSELHIKNQILAEELGRLNRLAGLGRWSGPSDVLFMSADVSGLITSGQSVAMIINRGRRDGVRPRDPVVALGGLVGIVQSVSLRTARVQAITDSISSVGVMDRNSRARGVIFGRGRNELMDFMPENEMQPINIHGALITSGFENSVFPKGIIVGYIEDRKQDTYGMTYGKVKPAVSFEALEEVLLVIPRSRLAGDSEATTATLGTKRIFMPGTPLTDDLADTLTTTSVLSPSGYGNVNLGTTMTLAPLGLGRTDPAADLPPPGLSTSQDDESTGTLEFDAPAGSAPAATPTPTPTPAVVNDFSIVKIPGKKKKGESGNSKSSSGKKSSGKAGKSNR